MKVLNIMNEIQEKVFCEYIGKVVYFMHDNKIVSGCIHNFDNFQLFVEGNADCIPIGFSIANDKEFFYTEQELLEYLSKNKIVVH